jgi:succinate dehydrogenase / fumarate reductase iron-sulfur subunit
LLAAVPREEFRNLLSLPDGSTFRFEILRYDAAASAPPRFQVFEVTAGKGMSVLQALLKIQDEQDPSLAFRYACRGAVCGSCAMSINGQLNLACRVQLDRLTTRRVVIEPLPNLEIIRDLVVDMKPFWDKYERVRPWLHEREAQERDGRMSEEERERFDQYVNCILCGLCYAACPVLKSNDEFTGPAALAKLYRFLADPRDERLADELQTENSRQGAWGCHTIARCIDACPKNVRPTDGIRGVRRQLLSQTLKKFLGRGLS